MNRDVDVLALITRHGRQLTRLSETRCLTDGRLLGATYRLPDGTWLWSAGYRQPPQPARIETAALCLDALDECTTADEERACYDGASEALATDTRPRARQKVAKIEFNETGRWKFAWPFAIPAVSGPNFCVTEVSCGCRRHYFLDLEALAKAAFTSLNVQRQPVHTAPLPPDFPQQVADGC